MTLRDAITAHIQQVDDDNELSGAQLGASIGRFLNDRGVVTDEATENGIEDFVYEVNCGVGYRHPKRLTGPMLADAIVEKFDLDKEY